MKKFLSLFLASLLLLTSVAPQAANQTLADKTATTVVSAGDIFYVLRDPSGTPLDRKIAFQYLQSNTLGSVLTSLYSYNTNGILTQTAANTFTGRTITGTTNEITVTNGNGVSGNPTLSLATGIDATKIANGSVSSTEFQYLDGSASGTFTPTISFAVPGDLSVVYGFQDGSYYRIGNLCFIRIRLSFTPTFTTASGKFSISGLPFAAVNEAWTARLTMGGWNNVNLDANYTYLSATVVANATTIDIPQSGDNNSATNIGAAHLATGVTALMNISGVYLTN